jgi:dihydroneopterin aldolase/2-amino-4-hydroxy-6-hydroxymethyldihydropteridine diphosphokinase
MTSPVRAVDLDAVPVEPVAAVLALGANLGERQQTLRAAVRELAATPGITVAATSTVYETDPVGGPDQPDYLNVVVLARTTLSPRALLHAGQRVEAAHGRERAVRWGARTLDVDLIAYATLVSRDGELTVPHPRAHERGFVLVPWADADPTAVLPGPRGGPVSDLAAPAADSAGVRPRPDVRLSGQDLPAGPA